MPRELSGVIACLQEIELALTSLKESAVPEGQRGLEEAAQAVRLFFQNPSCEAAQKVENLIRRKAASAIAPSSRLFRDPVSVDGHPTTLAALGLELAEVLEDLS